MRTPIEEYSETFRVLARHEVTIDGWRPALLNEIIGNVRDYYRLKRADRDAIGAAFALAAIPRATTKRRVKAIVRDAWRNLPDEDSIFKSLYDALVYHRYLISDQVGFVCHAEPEFLKSESRSTTIILEDLDAELPRNVAEVQAKVPRLDDPKLWRGRR